MAKTQEKTKLQKFTESLAKFLSKSWKTIIVILGAALLILAGLGIFDSIKKNKLVKSAESLQLLEKIYEEEWTVAEEDAKSELFEKINSEAGKIIEEFSGLYAAQKATLIMANVAYEQEKWNESAELYVQMADNYPDSFMAPLSLMYAATAKEEAGELEASKENYIRVVQEYPHFEEEVLRAKFNTGRLEELLGNLESAIEMYNSLVDQSPQNPWAMLAQSRLIFLSE